MSDPTPELHAPGDSSFVYEPFDSPPWRWRTVRPYVFEIDPDRYPALALAARSGPETEAKSPAGVPYGTLVPLFSDRPCALYIAPGYAWDGSTGGTEGEAGRRASCLHDALYQIMRRYELTEWGVAFRSDFRADADRLFYAVQRADGMPWWRRAVRWLAVRTWPGNVRRQGMAVYDGDKAEVRG